MNPRVLLVEDNDQNAYLATFLLEQAGAEVLRAPDGLIGFEMARSVRPDVVVLDIQLHHLDGYETAERLRADPATRAIPLVAATSFAMPGSRDRAAGLGFSDYLEKPIDPETFAARVLACVRPRPPS